MGLRIVSTGKAVPAERISNFKLSEMVETSDEWITSRTGIKNRFRCQEETCHSLAIEAAKKAIEKAGIEKEEIGAVLVATSSADYAFPSVACLLHDALGLKEEAISFDLSSACTGFLHCLAVANGLFSTIKGKYILIVGSEKLSSLLDYTDRTTCILFGDGAGAVLLEKSDKLYAQRNWTKGNMEYLNYHRNSVSYINMQGNEVFRFAVGALEKAVVEVLEEVNLNMDDIDYVVCHQANERIISFVMKRFKGHENKFYMNIAEYGNTSAASIPIALDEMNEKGMLTVGKKILCVGFGAGLSYSGALIEL